MSTALIEQDRDRDQQQQGDQEQTPPGPAYDAGPSEEQDDEALPPAETPPDEEGDAGRGGDAWSLPQSVPLP